MLTTYFVLQAIVCTLIIAFGVSLVVTDYGCHKIFCVLLLAISLIWLINLIHPFISLG